MIAQWPIFLRPGHRRLHDVSNPLNVVIVVIAHGEVAEVTERKTNQRSAVQVDCNKCRMKVILSRAHEVYITQYKYAPWFDGFDWYCAPCRTVNHGFFDVLDITISDVWRLGTHYEIKFGDERLARLYEEATGIRMPCPRNEMLSCEVDRFSRILSRCTDVSSIEWSAT
jgi:hypothetical protein